MLNTIDGPSEPVEDYLCDPEEMPLGARESRLPCPEDCVLSDWGPWSRCTLVRAEPTSESSSSAVWHRADMAGSDFCKSPLIWFSCWKNFSEVQEFKAWLYCIIVSSVWIFVNRLFLIHQGGIKEIYELGRRRKMAYISPILHCTHCAFSREGTWFMIKIQEHVEPHTHTPGYISAVM